MSIETSKSDIFSDAATALASALKGRKMIRGTYAEAFKMAGQATFDVDGNPAFFALPEYDSQQQVARGLHGKDPLWHSADTIWHVSVSRSHDAVAEEIAMVRANYPQRF